MSISPPHPLTHTHQPPLSYQPYLEASIQKESPVWVEYSYHQSGQWMLSPLWRWNWNMWNIRMHLLTELTHTFHEPANPLMCFKTHVTASLFPYFRREVFLVPDDETSVIQNLFITFFCNANKSKIKIKQSWKIFLKCLMSTHLQMQSGKHTEIKGLWA